MLQASARGWRTRRRWTSFLLLALTITALPTGGPTAHATDDGKISVTPETTGGGIRRTTFAYTLEPGATQTDRVVVSNLGDTPVDVNVYVANAFNTPSGKIGVKASDASVEEPATWLRYTSDLGNGRMTIPPQTSKSIPFDIRVPLEAIPGDYAFGIAAAPIVDPADATGGGNTVTVVTAVAALALIRVAGPLIPIVGVDDLTASVKAAPIPGLNGGKTNVSFVVYNAGNQRLSATLKIRQYDARSRLMYTYPEVALPSLLPGSRLPLSYEWGDAPVLRGRVTVEVTTDAGATVTRNTTFWAVPWGFLIALLVIIIVAIVLIRRRRARSQQGDVPQSLPTPEPVG
ncbi:MAG: WxL protein peptidoglycan domain-containing protein [Ilumatobacteraceae bacterium]